MKIKVVPTFKFDKQKQSIYLLYFSAKIIVILDLALLTISMPTCTVVKKANKYEISNS